ncbi:helix-hairpin-helix domain-containing protein [Parabacteroides sp. OttesenSCG-928-N08]|nr:helix-hairpin-helix domain-containing protein [Parabacteroides sp. OttesenSCG-928-N08]
MKKAYIYLIVGLLSQSMTTHTHAQALPSSERWMQYIEELAEETEDEELIEALFMELSYLTEHPMDINHATREQLRLLPFLSDIQVDSLLLHREKYGNLLTLYELKNIPELDRQTIDLILPFLYIGDDYDDKRPITASNLLKQGTNELHLRYDRCFQRKRGYESPSLSDSSASPQPNRRYLGEPFYHSLRYSYSFDNRIFLGLVGEKDTGEPFWNAHYKGYDYYSAHLLLKELKRIKTFVIGDYKASFGQGLVMSHDFTPGRSAIVTQAQRRNNGFRRHYSTNESHFLRGAAATITLGKLNLSLFYSFRKMDAAVDSNRFTTLKTDGIHRLPLDREKHRTVSMQTIGGNLRYDSPSWSIGVTALTYDFGRMSMQPDPKPYNRFYFRGKRNSNVAVDYLWRGKSLQLFGETALSQNGALATLNGMQISPTSYISLLILYRYYDRRYQAWYGKAFAQNSTVQNEEGVYLGMQIVPFPGWKLAAYADLFRFPWLKYNVDAPSSGKEYMGQIDYIRNRRLSLYLRYKFKQKEKNSTTESKTATIIADQQHRLRLQLLFLPTEPLTLRTSVDAILYRERGSSSKGYLIAQNIGWKPGKQQLFSGDLYIALFHTDNHATRISSYEKNILYAFSMPSFYGEGLRLAGSFRLELFKQLTLSAKIAHTRYFDRDKVGSNLEEITGKRKTDLYATLRWKF